MRRNQLEKFGRVWDLPCHFVVCGRCKGEGAHTNPNIDGNGITAMEMDELGPDFEEAYFRGDYDVTCEECKGEKVVLEVNRNQAKHSSPEELKEYDEWAASEAETEAMYAAERRMGC